MQTRAKPPQPGQCQAQAWTRLRAPLCILLAALLLLLAPAGGQADMDIPDLPAEGADTSAEGSSEDAVPEEGALPPDSSDAPPAAIAEQPARPLAEAGSAGLGSDTLAQARALVFGAGEARAALSCLSLAESPPRYKLERAAELLRGLAPPGSGAGKATPDVPAELALLGLIDWLSPLRGRSVDERNSAALLLLTRSQQLDPLLSESYLYQAWILAASGRIESARAQLRLGIQQAPGPELYATLLMLLGAPGLEGLPLGLQPQLPAAQLADEASAEISSLWQALLGQWPRHPVSLRADAQRLAAAQEAGNSPAALQAFERALAADPLPLPAEEAYVYKQLGLMYARSGQDSKASDAYRQSLALRYDPQLVRLLALSAARGGQQQGDAAWQQYLRTYAEDPRIWLAYGQYLEQQDDVIHALQQYESALYLDGDYAPALRAAAYCQLKLGQAKPAEARLVKALGIEPDLPAALALAQLLITQQRDAEAEASLRQALQAYPDQAELLQLRASVLTRLGRGAEAMELLAGKLDSLGRAEPALYFSLGQSAADSGDLNLAATFFERGLSFYPDDYALRREHALLLARQGRGDAALSAVLSARPILADHEFAALVDKLALYWIEQRLYSEGMAFMEQLIEALPRDPTAYSELALMLSAQGRFTDALVSVQRGLNDAGDNYLGRYLEAYLTFRLSGSQDALPLARALLDHPQADANGFVLYLRLVEERGDYIAQAEAAQRGLELFPGHKDLFAFEARALYFSGDTPAVISLLEDPQYAQIPFASREEMLGSAYLDESSPVKAVALLKAAVAARPDNAQLLAALAQAHYALGEYPEARSLCQQALRAKPDCSTAQLWLGFALEATGEVELAQQNLDLVVRSPLSSREELAWAALGLARVALDRGEGDEASTRLGEADAFGYYAPYFQSELERSKSAAGL